MPNGVGCRVWTHTQNFVSDLLSVTDEVVVKKSVVQARDGRCINVVCHGVRVERVFAAALNCPKSHVTVSDCVCGDCVI